MSAEDRFIKIFKAHMLVVVDLDGTLAKPAPNAQHCMGHMTKEDILRIMDPVIIAKLEPRKEIISIVNEHYNNGATIAVITGRWDLLYNVTEAWLAEHKIEYYELHMRKFYHWDKEAVDVKICAFRDYYEDEGYKDVTWIDDDPKMLDAITKLMPNVKTVQA